MQIEIVTVGRELLEGRIQDENASFLARSLVELGHEVTGIRTVADEVAAVVGALTEALAHGDAVIMTGGLGVTPDDITRRALSRLSGKALVANEELHRRLERRYRHVEREMPVSVHDQARVPAGAHLLRNPVGQAPGILLKHKRKEIYALPGVPGEMRALARGEVFPRLAGSRSSRPRAAKVLSLYGLGEAEVAERLAVLDLTDDDHRISYLPRGHCLELVLTVRHHSEESARRAAAALARRIGRELGEVVFSTREDTLERVVGRLLAAGGLQLAVAESVTGGLIGHLLTRVPGSSRYLDRVTVAYSNRAKVAELGVSPGIIRRFGAVSPEVAAAMARGVRRVARVPVGLSTTGIAGPSGGSAAKPVGLVYVGVAAGRRTVVRRHMLGGQRERIKERAALAALDELRLLLLAKKKSAGGGGSHV